MMKRAVSYARVSTDDQADKGYSLPSQLELCRKYAERLGFEIVAELREDYSGATPIAERPDGKKLAALLKSGQADAVIVYQVDRLSRDIVDLLATVRLWLRAGVEVHTCDIGKIESELDIVLVIKGWQGSDERKKIVERTSRGRYAKAKAGKVVGNGWSPYGYRYVVEAFEIVEGEAKIVCLIFRWFVDGDEDGHPLSLRAIARKLSEMGVSVPRSVGRVRSARLWDHSTVYRILSNETYIGVWHYGKQIWSGGKRGTRSTAEQVAVPVPAIVDRETWEQAQARLEYNKQMASRNAKREYLLRGRVRCGCDYAMVGDSHRGRESYWYRCARHGRYFAGLEEKQCTEKAARGDVLETVVWEYVLDLWSNRERFEKALRAAQVAEQEAEQPKREQLAIVLEQIAESEAEAAKLADAIKNVKGGAVGRALQEKIDHLESLYAAQLCKRDELQAALDTNQLTDDSIELALRFREDVVVGMQNPTFEDKRRALEFLRTQVTVKDGKARVKCRVLVQPRVFELRVFYSPRSRPGR